MRGSVDIILDGQFGSSGKGKLSTWLADNLGYHYVSSANFPNAGHTAVLDDGFKFVAKAIPTAACLNRVGKEIKCYITPGSGFSWHQLGKEWLEAGKPLIDIHERACVMTEEHAARERSGADSTAHIASTMQGTAAAMTDKILRKTNAPLARDSIVTVAVKEFSEFVDKVRIVPAFDFRDELTAVLSDYSILHEGSQGYALSIDHGASYPYCTSRNCTTAAALDYLGIAPQRLGDVWLNLRTYPIRVGSIAEGSSGPFYTDSQEVTWEQVGKRAFMPPEEIATLAERERTTVTKRVRRVSTFSMTNLRDAVQTNGATKISLNFVQYLNWMDSGQTCFDDLSYQTRAFVEEIEDAVHIPVVLIGTGAKHSEMVVREEFL